LSILFYIRIQGFSTGFRKAVDKSPRLGAGEDGAGKHKNPPQALD